LRRLPNVKIYRYTRHSRRKRTGHGSGVDASESARRKRVRIPRWLVPEHGLLPAPILGMTGLQIETLGQLKPIIQHARELLHPSPSDE
jgi:hypothetical protein